MTIDVDPDVHAQLAAAAAAAAKAGGRTVSYCDVIRKLLEEAAGARDTLADELRALALTASTANEVA
jgi:hypothetical protein